MTGEGAARAREELERGHAKAEHFLGIGRIDLAEREIAALLRADPDDGAAHLLRTRALLGKELVDEAETALQDALRCDPESIPAIALQGTLRAHRGLHREAEEIFLAALRLAPGIPALWVLYGELLVKTGHMDKAERVARRALALDPDDESAHGLLGRVLASGWRARLGVRHGERGVALAPDSDATHASLGYTYLHSGHPFRARRHLREALRLDPTDADLQAAYLEADTACRLVYLPMYWWSHLVDRLPGKQVGAWVIFIVVLQGLRWLDAPELVIGVFAFGYLLLVVYTWVAHHLVRAWIRFFPAR